MSDIQRDLMGLRDEAIDAVYENSAKTILSAISYIEKLQARIEELEADPYKGQYKRKYMQAKAKIAELEAHKEKVERLFANNRLVSNKDYDRLTGLEPTTTGITIPSEFQLSQWVK